MKAVLWLIGRAAGNATQVSKLGYDALPDLVLNPQGMAGIGIAFFGIALLAFNNSTAWKETGGY